MVFDLGVDYRIANAGTPDRLSLDVLPRGHDMTPGRFEAVILKKTGPATGQKWRFVRSGLNGAGPRNTYLLASAVRDDTMKMTSTTTQNPFALAELEDQSKDTHARRAQYWRFTAVPGQPDTYTIENIGRRELVLAATADGKLTLSEADPNNPLTHWHIAPFGR